MVALLKSKSKVIVQRKPRKTYEVKNLFKRAKSDETITQSQRNQVSQILSSSGTGRTVGKIAPQIIVKYDETMTNQGNK